jgi:hypothetical protein
MISIHLLSEINDFIQAGRNKSNRVTREFRQEIEAIGAASLEQISTVTSKSASR